MFLLAQKKHDNQRTCLCPPDHPCFQVSRWASASHGVKTENLVRGTGVVDATRVRGPLRGQGAEWVQAAFPPPEEGEARIDTPSHFTTLAMNTTRETDSQPLVLVSVRPLLQISWQPESTSAASRIHVIPHLHSCVCRPIVSLIEFVLRTRSSCKFDL